MPTDGGQSRQSIRDRSTSTINPAVLYRELTSERRAAKYSNCQYMRMPTKCTSPDRIDCSGVGITRPNASNSGSPSLPKHTICPSVRGLAIGTVRAYDLTTCTRDLWHSSGDLDRLGCKHGGRKFLGSDRQWLQIVFHGV